MIVSVEIVVLLSSFINKRVPAENQYYSIK